MIHLGASQTTLIPPSSLLRYFIFFLFPSTTSYLAAARLVFSLSFEIKGNDGVPLLVQAALLGRR